METEDWGPKPFKFNNEWFQKKDFLPFVETKWKEIEVQGRGDFVMKEKLRNLKDRLRWWNINVFGKFDIELEEGVREINVLDEMGSDLEGIEEDKKKDSKKLCLNLKIKENMIIQKARMKWLNDDDVNNKLFHAVINNNLRRNHIGTIDSSRGLLRSVREVQDEVFENFADKFKEVDLIRQILEGTLFSMLDVEDKILLEVPFQ